MSNFFIKQRTEIKDGIEYRVYKRVHRKLQLVLVLTSLALFFGGITLGILLDEPILSTIGWMGLVCFVLFLIYVSVFTNDHVLDPEYDTRMFINGAKIPYSGAEGSRERFRALNPSLPYEVWIRHDYSGAPFTKTASVFAWVITLIFLALIALKLLLASGFL